jgi:type IV secretion system protein VirD4
MSGETSDLYGSSALFEEAPTHIEAFTSGSTSIPLGHNPGNRYTGLAFDFAPGGDPGHALTFGATRSGKGVNAIIPALLTYEGSVVVLDPKGENSFITSPYRSKFSRCVTLDPWNEVNERYGSQIGVTDSITRFNPLSALDPAGKNFADDVAAIADALIIPGSGEAHWFESARELIAGLIIAVVEQSPGKGSIRDVRKLLVASTPVFIEAVSEIVEKSPDSLAARKLARFTTESRETNSIRSVAQTQTAILDSPTLLDAMETDEEPFNLAEIGTGKVSLYLVLPVDKLATHGRWLRLVLTLAIRILSRQRKPPELPVLFVLDEMGTIGPLAMVEQSFGLMAGLGIRVWGFLQDLAQLQRDYPQSWETFWSNASMVQILTCGDLNTSRHVSDYLGSYTVNAKTGGWSYKQKRWGDGEKDAIEAADRASIQRYLRSKYSQKQLNAPANSPDFPGMTFEEIQIKQSMISRRKFHEEIQEQHHNYKMEWVPDEQLASRPVLFPDEVRNSPADSLIIILPGRGNYRLKRFAYFSDPVLSTRARHDPNKPAPVILEVRPVVRPAPPPPPPVVEPVATSEPQADPASPGGGFSIPTSGDELAAMGKDLGKKAASALGNYLKDRLNPPR